MNQRPDERASITSMRAHWRRIALVTASGIVAGLLVLLGSTWNRRTLGRKVWPHWRRGATSIYLIYHNTILMGLLDGHASRSTTLISQHGDGEVATQLARWLGIRVVRGSTSRRAVGAFFELKSQAEEGCLIALTADGPRGPRYILKNGPLALAAFTGARLIPVSYGVDRFLRIPSWDQFRIPLPFARVWISAGKEIMVPADADRDRLESIRVQLEEEMIQIARSLETQLKVPELFRTRRLRVDEDPRPQPRRATLVLAPR